MRVVLVVAAVVVVVAAAAAVVVAVVVAVAAVVAGVVAAVVAVAIATMWCSLGVCAACSEGIRALVELHCYSVPSPDVTLPSLFPVTLTFSRPHLSHPI